LFLSYISLLLNRGESTYQDTFLTREKWEGLKNCDSHSQEGRERLGCLWAWDK